MNFLSHYYFDQDHPSNYHKLGILLPDMIKGFNKKLRKEVFQNKHSDKKEYRELLKGIQRHYEIDKIFHQLPFFQKYSAIIKELILSKDIPEFQFRTYFLAHILLEFLLDRLLVKQNPLLAVQLYEDLDNLNRSTLTSYFVHIGREDFLTEFFGIFLSFTSKRYLLHYPDNDTFINALLWLYKKINPIAFSQDSKCELIDVVETMETLYPEALMNVFDSVNQKATPTG